MKPNMTHALSWGFVCPQALWASPEVVCPLGGAAYTETVQCLQKFNVQSEQGRATATSNTSNPWFVQGFTKFNRVRAIWNAASQVCCVFARHGLSG